MNFTKNTVWRSQKKFVGNNLQNCSVQFLARDSV